MFSIDLAWKTFNVDLDAVEAWMKANITGYVGSSGDADLTLWFYNALDQDHIDAVNNYWNALTNQSAEAISYKSAAYINTAIQAAQTDALTKTWDQLSVAQRKLMMGLSPTRADLGL